MGFCHGVRRIRLSGATGELLPAPPPFDPGDREKERPINGVWWDEAKANCEWAGGRLPSEAEWEYAARGGKEGLKYLWGNQISHENANYYGSEWEGTSPAGNCPTNGGYDVVLRRFSFVGNPISSESLHRLDDMLAGDAFRNRHGSTT